MTIQEKQDGTTKVTFRIPTSLYERIKEAAKFSGRPLNSEVITWLQFRDIAASLDEIKQQNQELRQLVIDRMDAVGSTRK